ncbi:hypothetical protein A11Q_1613 [Pseudobdellovibrio exovorus JSS]|uniref:J domain-containing protein n=2 Tax=Pseudobdellovibrio exovorus TaxID=453816 RepID=M4VRL9_9BACT|nr:hypothetical protein A11Q_1613 [Pseudobdellovibrio exovorus JSS]
MTQDQNDTSVDFTSGWESHHDPYGLAQLLGQISIQRPSAHYTTMGRAQKAYPRPSLRPQAPKSPEFTPEYNRSDRQAHNLTPEQLQAYSALKAYAPSLNDNFDLHELKSAYRRSVLSTHPDRGGNSESFHLVKKSYQILSSLVTK